MKILEQDLPTDLKCVGGGEGGGEVPGVSSLYSFNIKTRLLLTLPLVRRLPGFGTRYILLLFHYLEFLKSKTTSIIFTTLILLRVIIKKLILKAKYTDMD